MNNIVTTLFKTDNVSERRKIRKRDNTPKESISIDGFCSLMIYIDMYCRDHKIHFESFSMLCLIVEYYKEYGLSVSSSKISTLLGIRSKSYVSTISKVDTLVKRGLLDHVGYGYLKCNLFAPTQKAIDSLNAIVELVNE